MYVHHAPNPWIGFVATAITVAVVFTIRARRMSKVQPLRRDRLWMVPAAYLAIVALSFAMQPPTATGWLASAAALLVGAALGWQRGKTVRIHLDPDTGELNQKASVAGMVFLLVLIMVKAAARAGGTAMHLDVATFTDALLALALGTFTLMRVEMLLRAKRLLAGAGAVRTT